MSEQLPDLHLEECDVEGHAEVRSHYRGDRVVSIEWLHCDERVHVTDALVKAPGAVGMLSTRYLLEERCPARPETWHARRREGVTEDGIVAGQRLVTLGDRARRGDAP